MDITVQFDSIEQESFYYSVARNQDFSGGFNNGKTWVGCLKTQNLLSMFPNYKVFIGRETYADLKRTTMQTFFKMIPSELVLSHNEQDGFTMLTNGSVVHWIHCDNIDESTARGLEVNSGLIDQAEEIEEKVFDVLDARIGRWDGAVVPAPLLELHEKRFGVAWPTNKFGKWIVPSYFMLLNNPDTEFHWIYRKFHPNSTDRDNSYFYVEGQWRRELGSEESYDKALERDPEWVAKYVKGQWGSSSSAVHFLRKESILDPTPELLERIATKGNLFRILDHGDTAPTCCLWACAIDGVYIFYREYYVASKLISYHRQAIHDLSKGEAYSGEYADPQIFKKTAQKQGGFWSVADEYRDSDLPSPELIWTPADNNEFATRNRINEFLQLSARFRHPITRESPAPAIYFIRSSMEYPHGCKEAIKQIQAQRKVILGTLEGKTIYSDDRDENIPDHAYDPVRYFIAMHGSSPRKAQKQPPRMSMAYYNNVLKAQEVRRALQ